MRWVHFYQRDFATGRTSIVVTCILGDKNDRVEISGSDSDLMARLQRGVLIPIEDRVVTPRDGEKFLQALKNEFRGLNLAATAVQAGDQIDYPESATA
ncbi:hypothetical protein KKF05_01245 [Patescibacteria group bacterium]|nr:hypothetical protein [Patescibacteria group bacterium]MBU1028849.1 hypothetical protein [Patescibacteria group bacterium]MBU1916187.1 hypothetical protein [Patescibacteria group bacterium]